MPICFLFGFRDVAEPYRSVTRYVIASHSSTATLTSVSASEGDDAAEVTGSADVEHLSRFAPLRRARSAIHEAKSSAGSGAASSNKSYPSTSHSSLRPPHLVSSQQAPLSASPSEIINHPVQNLDPVTVSIPSQAPAISQPPTTLQLGPDQVLPSLRPDYMASVSEPLSLEQADVAPNLPAMGAAMMDGIPQPSVDDYIRTADEMSGYLTWQAMTVPSWLNFGDMFPPG
jgi:hypothetical protein